MSVSDAKGQNPAPLRWTLWHQDLGLLSGVWLFMTAAYVVGGAYDTDDFPVLHRLALWLLVCALMVFQPAFIERMASRYTRPTKAGAWLSAILALLVSIPLISAEVHLLKSTPILPREPDPWIEFIPFIASPVIVVTGFVLFLRFAWENRHIEAAQSEPGDRGAAEGASRDMGPEVLYVRSQDHYLEIATDSARRFVRGRLADLAAHGHKWGCSPHRSWWVADRAVKQSERKGRDIQLVLADGTKVPVGRSRLENVKSRGWV